MNTSCCGMFRSPTKPAWPNDMRRRTFLYGSGAFAAALPFFPAQAQSVVEIVMAGRRDGSKVWFNPFGVLVRPGQTVRWINRDKGNSHTATAYAPENDDHPRRIPDGASAFDSDYLLTDESFEVSLTVPGIYDYYCIPHELSGMVGRIVVADPGAADFADYSDGDLDPMILNAFPPVAGIMDKGALHHEES